MKAPSRRLIVVTVTAAALLLVASVAAFQYTSRPEFCASCHEIRPSVEGWQASSHGENEWADCMDCHSPPGFFGELWTHVEGLQEVYVHTTQNPENGDLRGNVPANRCLECHDDYWESEDFAPTHPTRDAPCAVCHRTTFHTNPNPVHDLAGDVEDEQ